MGLHLIIVAAALPPALDGIGDYTATTAAELARQGAAVEILVSGHAAVDPVPGVTVTPGAFDATRPRSCWGLADALAERRPDWALLQYNPFSYGRRGFNPVLPAALRRAKRRTPGLRLAVMAHEVAMPADSLRNAVMRSYQLWQFHRLGKVADLMLFSMSKTADAYRRRHPGRRVEHLPVGSNLPRVEADRDQVRAELGIPPKAVVLGVFGTAHPSRLLGHVAAAAAAVRASGRDGRVLYIGPDGEKVRAALGESIPLLDRGPLPPAEASRSFAAMDVYLCPFIDGVSTRRTSFFVGLQHGVATVTTRGKNTDEELLIEDGRSFSLAPAGARASFANLTAGLCKDSHARWRTGKAGSKLFHTGYSAPILGRRTFGTLQPAEQEGLIRGQL